MGFDATVGRVLRFRDADEFSTGSGLRNAQSDWVASWSARYDPYVTLRHRLRLGAEDLDVTRNALSLGLRVDPVRLSADYVFLDADPVADAPEDREEISARLALDITDEWAVTGSLRHDLEEERFVFLGGGIRFRNECCSLSAFVRRNFTRTDTVDASTSFGVRLELLTLGGGGGELPGAGLYDGNDS
jgi:LPS-assembly protein